MITEIRLEQDGANDTSATVVGWTVEDGQRVAAGDPLAEVETAKVTVEIAAPGPGYVVTVVPSRAEADVGDVLAYLCPDAAELDTARRLRDEAAPAGPADGAADADGGQRISPAAREHMAEHGIAPERFAGMAVVTLRDVQAAAAEPEPSAAPASRAKALEIERLSRANVLNAALSVQLDGTALRAWAATAPVPSLRVLAAVVHAVGRSLAAFPALNAWFDGAAVRTHDTVGVGVAIDLDDGLKVGVVHGADTAAPDGVEARIRALVSAYLDESLTVADVSGGTVTVSDLSSENVLTFAPLLNDRQALAIGVGGDATLLGAPFTLSATFDHRVTSGREVAQFLAACRRELAATAGATA